MVDKSETPKQMNSYATQIRKEVVDMAIKRRNGDRDAEATWIPALSKLSGYILDHIGFMTKAICQKSGARSFEMQEYSNLLSAWSTVDRADPEIFDIVVEQMIFRQEKDMDKPGAAEKPHPQDMRPVSCTLELRVGTSRDNAFGEAAVYCRVPILICFSAPRQDQIEAAKGLSSIAVTDAFTFLDKHAVSSLEETKSDTSSADPQAL